MPKSLFAVNFLEMSGRKPDDINSPSRSESMCFIVVVEILFSGGQTEGSGGEVYTRNSFSFLTFAVRYWRVFLMFFFLYFLASSFVVCCLSQPLAS